MSNHCAIPGYVCLSPVARLFVYALRLKALLCETSALLKPLRGCNYSYSTTRAEGTFEAFTTR